MFCSSTEILLRVLHYVMRSLKYLALESRDYWRRIYAILIVELLLTGMYQGEILLGTYRPPHFPNNQQQILYTGPNDVVYDEY